MKLTKVRGTMTISWSVDLPEETQRKGVTTDDPAIGAVLDFLPQSGFVYTWGEDKEPAEVWLETHEDDVEIEEDNRLDSSCDG